MSRFYISCLLFVCVGLTSSLSAQVVKPTTYYIVRHADRDGTNDALTMDGKKRAEHLRDLMKHFRVAAVYSTQTVRTESTAKPTATELGLTIEPYDLNPMWLAKVKTNHQGKAVLIVGHSNTAGEIVKGLGGVGDFSIGHEDFDNLFVVTLDSNGSKAVRVKYGK